MLCQVEGVLKCQLIPEQRISWWILMFQFGLKSDNNGAVCDKGSHIKLNNKNKNFLLNQKSLSSQTLHLRSNYAKNICALYCWDQLLSYVLFGVCVYVCVHVRVSPPITPHTHIHRHILNITSVENTDEHLVEKTF